MPGRGLTPGVAAPADHDHQTTLVTRPRFSLDVALPRVGGEEVRYGRKGLEESKA